MNFLVPRKRSLSVNCLRLIVTRSSDPSDNRSTRRVPNRIASMTTGSGAAAPVERAGVCSWIFMGWVNSLIAAGYHHPLEYEDLWPTASQDQVNVLFTQFWDGDTAPEIHDGAPADAQQVQIERRLWRMFYKELMRGAALYMIFMVCGLLSPVLLWALVDQLEKHQWSEGDFHYGLGIVLMLFLLQLVAAVAQGLSDFVSVRAAVRARSVHAQIGQR